MINKIVTFSFNKGTTLKDFIDEIEKTSKDCFIKYDMVIPVNISFSFMDEPVANKIEDKWS